MMPRSLVLALALISTSAAAAQETPTPTAAPVSEPIRTLDKALEFLAWDAGENGVLLVVNPQRTWIQHREQGRVGPADPLSPPAASGTYRLHTLADRFGRKIIRLPTLTVLAPVTMEVLNARPGRPDPLAAVGGDEKMLLLQGSLSPGQWRKLGSPAGLGVEDLAPKQQPLLLAILPEPFTVINMSLRPDGSPDIGAQKTLSAGEKRNVRLRLWRSTFVTVATDGRGISFLRRTPRQPLEPQSFPPQLLGYSDTIRTNAYGVALRQIVPSRLKPGHLPFDAPALNASVPLTNAATVGDVIRRVGQTCRLELHADRRVADLPVWTRGETAARAGDVLQALCLAVTGTFRRIDPEQGGSPAFILTDDVEGIGTRRMRLAEWLSAARAEEQALVRKAQENIQAQRPIQYVSLAEDDPLASRPEVMRKIEQSWEQEFPRLNGYDFPLTELPPDVQERVRDQAARLAEQNHVVQPDRAKVGVNVRLSFIVPGIGQIDSHAVSSSSLTSLLPPRPLLIGVDLSAPQPPAAVRSKPPAVFALPPVAARALYVAPTDAASASRIAREAAARGFSHLWIEVPPEENAPNLLDAAIAAGRENKLAVFAVVRLLQRRPKAESGAPAQSPDVNLLGESLASYVARRKEAPGGLTPSPSNLMFPRRAERLAASGDWLRVDVPGTAALLNKHLTKIAATPGLAGLVLTDTAAPGYGRTDSRAAQRIEGAEASDLGYTVPMRLAFLRQEGYDPIDLMPVSFGGGISLETPFFRDTMMPSSGVSQVIHTDGRIEDRIRDGSQTPLAKWNDLRRQTNERFVTELVAALRADRPGLPVFIHDRSDLPMETSYFRLWKEPGTASGKTVAAWLQQEAPPAERVVNITYTLDNPSSLTGYLKSRWDPKIHARAQGIVVDLSEMSLDKALSALKSSVSAREGTAGVQ